MGPQERQRGEEGCDGARVADGESPSRHPTLMGGRGEIGEVGVVVDEGALVAEVPDDPEDEAPVDHPGLDGGEEGGGGHGERGKPDEERPPYARAVGEPAQEGRGQSHRGHGDGDHPPPPQIAEARLVAHHRHRVVRGVDRGEHHRGERGVGEIVERPRHDGPHVHGAAPSRTRPGTCRSSSWNSAMMARRRSRR